MGLGGVWSGPVHSVVNSLPAWWDVAGPPSGPRYLIEIEAIAILPDD